jgi:hypothetical protein
MPLAFSRSLRALGADRFRHSLGTLAGVGLFFIGGIAWAFLARVAVYEVSHEARLARLKSELALLEGETATRSETTRYLSLQVPGARGQIVKNSWALLTIACKRWVSPGRRERGWSRWP